MLNWRPHDKIETLQYCDADKTIINKMNEMIREAVIGEREINWEKFKKYCYEYFEVPDCVIDRCLKEVM